jgi:predicted NUDIX family phosphoesterase
MAKEILVVSRDILFRGKEFQGFVKTGDNDFVETIISNYAYKERALVENDANLKQPIPYIWLINPKTKKIFIYKRNLGKGDYKETRHFHNYSGGVGGHIDRDTEEKSPNPIQDAMMRELKEEITMQNYPVPKIIGFINSEIDTFNSVHFGIIGIAETTENAKPTDDGIAEGDFYSAEEIEKLFSNPSNKVENWTKLSWPFVKEYISKL